MAAAADKAYEILKQRVVGGTYAPGAQLKEEHLARELEISRTPIRAALKRLVDDGLATADPNRGVRVAEWTEFDIEETFELRGLLEAHAAELAARRGGRRAGGSAGRAERADGPRHRRRAAAPFRSACRRSMPVPPGHPRRPAARRACGRCWRASSTCRS